LFHFHVNRYAAEARLKYERVQAGFVYVIRIPVKTNIHQLLFAYF
jgi:hypothetical protein